MEVSFFGGAMLMTIPVQGKRREKNEAKQQQGSGYSTLLFLTTSLAPVFVPWYVLAVRPLWATRAAGPSGLVTQTRESRLSHAETLMVGSRTRGQPTARNRVQVMAAPEPALRSTRLRSHPDGVNPGSLWGDT